MSPGERARAVLTGAVAGFLGGFLGVGGGIVLIPMLTGWFRLTQHQAHGTSLAIIGATAVGGLVSYGLKGQVDWKTALVAGIASALTAPLGARWATRTSPAVLRRGFAVVMAVVAVRLLWRAPSMAAFPIPGDAARLALDLFLGGVVGLFSGFMGVGGGALAVPFFTLLLGMGQHLAQGTSLGLILVAAPAGALEHARQGNLVSRLILPAALGAIAAAPLGTWLAQAIANEVLAKGFAFFLLATPVVMWRQGGVGARDRPASSGP